MSNVSTRHDVIPFVAGTSKPMATQRLAKVGYKKTKDNPNPLSSVCASVPMIAIDALTDAQRDALMPHIKTMLEDTQDKIFRSLYENAHGSLDVLTDDDISVDACIAFLTIESAGGRMTMESIGAWFDQCVADNLFVVIAEKLRFNDPNAEQMEVIAKHLAGWRALMVSLGGKGVSLEPQKRNNLRLAISLSSGDDDIGKKLVAKLDAMEKKSDAELIDLI